jgi:hypothetical protein
MEGRNAIGKAQIYNQTQSAVNTYARTIAQQQAKREAEQKALQDDLAKVKVDGIRQGDIPEFTTKYNEAKDIHAKLVSAKNSADKIKFDREFKTRMLELGEIAQDSKALAKGEEAFTGVLLNPNARDRYKEDSVSQFQLSKTLSRKDPRFIRDLTKLEQQVDLSGFTQKVNSIRKTLLESERPVRSETVGKQGNRDGVYVTNTKSVPPEKQAIAYAMEFDIDPKFRGAMRQMFPQFANLDMADLKAKAIPELINLMPIEAFKEEEFKANDMWDERFAKRGAAIRSRPSKSGSGANVGDYTVETNVRLEGEVPTDEYDNEIAGAKKPTSALFLEKSVGFDSDSFPIIKAEGFDVASQKNIDNISGNFVIGKLAYVKIVGKQTPEIRAIIINSKGKKFSVNPKSLPIGIRKSKNYEAAISALGDPPTKATQPTVNDQYKQAIEWLKANPNSPDAKGVRELLKSKGVIK